MKIRAQFFGKVIFCGIDRLESLKGIPLKLLGLERFLHRCPEWVGKIVLVQVGISAYERGEDYVRTRTEVLALVNKLNLTWPGTVQFQECSESEMRLQQRMALLRAADVIVVTPLRDGLNLLPLVSVLLTVQLGPCDAISFVSNDRCVTLFPGVHNRPPRCSDGPREERRAETWTLHIIRVLELHPRHARRTARQPMEGTPNCTRLVFFLSILSFSQTIAFFFVQVSEIANAFHQALTMSDDERLRRLSCASEFVTRVTTQRWALAVMLDLKGVYKNVSPVQFSGAGLGLGFRLLGMETGFSSLDIERVAKVFRKARARIILLDYGGTIVDNDNVSAAASWARCRILYHHC